MATVATEEALPLIQEIEYPYSDGKPMAETDVHLEEMINHIKGLQEYFRDQPDVYVAGNLFIYYEKGNPRAVVAPDCFVVQGVAKKKRLTYKLWEEGVVPSFVLEITSKSTQDEDTGSKMAKYARLGVPECYHFDPLGEYLTPNLQGYRLEAAGDGYDKMAPRADGSFLSRALGVTLAVEGEHLRMRDATTGQLLLWVDELQAQRRGEQAAREKAEAARQQAEAARQQAEAARQQAEVAQQQAEVAQQQAEADREAESRARQQAEAVRQQERVAREQAESRARAAEEELVRLRRELGRGPEQR